MPPRKTLDRIPEEGESIPLPPRKGGKGDDPDPPEMEPPRYSGTKAREAKRNTLIMVVAVCAGLLLILGGVAVVVLLTQQPQPPPTQPPVVPPVVPPQGNTTAPPANGTQPASTFDEDTIKAALAQRNETLCELINVSADRQRCYEGLAGHLLSACLHLTDQAKLYTCVTAHAVELNTTDVCINLNANDSRSCRVAVDPCYYKTGTEGRTCRAVLRSDYTLCAADKECIINYSMIKQDRAPCAALPETAEQFACVGLAERKEECSKLFLPSQQDYCNYLYAVNRDEYLWCSTVAPDTIYAVWCYSHFAVENRTLAMCDQSLSLNNRWDCYTNYSLETNDIKGCVAIHRLASTARFNCFWSYAKLYGDTESCVLLNDSGFALTCYVGAIMNNTKLDYTKCANVTSDVWKNKCYMQSAKNAKDESLCDYIVNTLERDSCIAEVRSVK